MKEKNKCDQREVISDCLLISGGVTVSIGFGVLHIAAGIIVAGALTILFGYLVARGGDGE